MDPSGVARLSAEEARDCGFPDISTFQTVWAYSWDTEVHAGIRQFHEAKGFDLNSQDVAIELGYPLFQVSCTPMIYWHICERLTQATIIPNRMECLMGKTKNQSAPMLRIRLMWRSLLISTAK
ncbi:hypothetical protein B0H14DRAFT_2471115 [Mycena olivaceomarginata]|nr:hypothetical protein B0H14DRAFT_2471115 [Mycena olivaceomarginata]